MLELQMLVCLGVILLAIGVAVGTRWERNYWLLHGNCKRQHRTAICADRKFFYVIPESEYVATRVMDGPRSGYPPESMG